MHFILGRTFVEVFVTPVERWILTTPAYNLELRSQMKSSALHI